MSERHPNPIRVGVVGANPTRGWASSAHLPALACLPEFDVVAVATTRQESATAAAEQFGTAHAFTSAEDLATHPDVDLVAVTVKVPSHASVIRAALTAGKHVVSEWPLAVDVDEAAELTELARQAGVVHAVGLQGFHSADARYVGELIATGRIGELRSVTVVVTGGMRTRLSRDMAWVADRAAGTGILAVMGGHTLATVTRTLGVPIEQLSGQVANLDPEATVIETGERIPVTAHNQVGLLGRLQGGPMISVALQGNSPLAAAGFTMQIVGTEGVLRITAPQAGTFIHIHGWQITLIPAEGEPEQLSVPSEYRTVPDDVPAGPPLNVAGLYREVATAIAEGRAAEPSFDRALAYHRLVATIERASETGTVRQVPAESLVPGNAANSRLTH